MASAGPVGAASGEEEEAAMADSGVNDRTNQSGEISEGGGGGLGCKEEVSSGRTGEYLYTMAGRCNDAK